ncbi:MAG: DUF4231 domain-containing protein [Candidatus Korobacteraceae bacterium]
MSTAPVAIPEIPGPVGARLEDQIAYHSKKSARYQKYYKRIKVAEIIAAALIPFLAALHVSDTIPIVHFGIGIVTAALGVMITILEGILQLYQFQQIWITSRATCESMTHEKFMYLAKAGAYATAPDPLALLAERIETIGSQENSKWASIQQPAKAGVHGAGAGEPS